MSDPAGVASLPMYPFAAWRDATDALWEAVRGADPRLPPLAAWGPDAHGLWHDPAMVVSQACGWPLVTELAGRVRVVGTFRYRTPDWSGDHYRSVVVARDHTVTAAGTSADTRAAVNSTASLSGWISLVWFATGGAGGRWPGCVVLTGAHLESVRAVRDGDADLASIDAVTYAHLERDQPELLRGVRRVGEGPLVPCLPIVAPAPTSDADVALLRAALTAAIAARPDAAATLLIDGFSPLDDDAYASVAALAPSPH